MGYVYAITLLFSVEFGAVEPAPLASDMSFYNVLYYEVESHD